MTGQTRGQEMQAAILKGLLPFESEKAAVLRAQAEVDRLRGKVEDLARQIEGDEIELAELRIKISDEVAAGKPGTKSIGEAATLKAQIEVRKELLEDLQCGKVQAAAEVAREALATYQTEAGRALRRVRNDHQALIAGLAVQMADLIEAWNEALDSWCEANRPLVSGEQGNPFTTAPMFLRFPRIEPGANPIRTRALAERGEL